MMAEHFALDVVIEEPTDEEIRDLLSALARELAEKRAEAIRGRMESGIENDWELDERYYEGIDGDVDGTWSTKPVGSPDVSNEYTGSTAFLNITRPYVDTAASSLTDMLMPTDDTTFEVVPTPVPDLINLVSKGLPPHIRDELLAESGGDEEKAKQAEDILIEELYKRIDEAKDAARRAQRQIEDWLVECRYHAAVRKVIHDAAKVGSGVLKGPFPSKIKSVAYKDGALIFEEKIAPASQWVSYWNLYPDPNCGESIHNGAYVFERDEISKSGLRDLIGQPGYIDSEILEVLREGPKEAEPVYRETSEMKARKSSEMYEIWYFYGGVERSVFESALRHQTAGADTDYQGEVVHAHVVMVNNRIIRLVVNPLDTGEFPYDVLVWQERRNSPWGIGVANQLRTVQRMLNAATRCMLDNAGMAGGPMWAVKPGLLTPIDGVIGIAPRKGWIASEDADVEDLRGAFTFYKVDMMVNELMAIITFALKMAEDVTGLPMILQGQFGAVQHRTLGQTEILQNNANVVRRRIARLFDDLMTVPHIQRYYRYLLQYGEDDRAKGDFKINARGSSNLIERAAQREQLAELIVHAANPVFGIDPKKAFKQWLRTQKFDPKEFEYDDEEWRQVVQNLANQQSDKLQVEQLRAQVEQLKLQTQERIAAAKIQSQERVEAYRGQLEQALAQFQADLRKELAVLNAAGKKEVQLDRIKADLESKILELSAKLRSDLSRAR